jgi:hypothetical protein
MVAQSFDTSTLKTINDVSKNLLPPPILKSFGLDANNDGVMEQWNITVGLRLPTGLQLSSINLIAAFDY